MKKSFKLILIIFAVLIVALIVWGLIGSAKAAEIGTTCDFGIGEDGSVFCWTWYRNAVGQIGDAVQGLF